MRSKCKVSHTSRKSRGGGSSGMAAPPMRSSNHLWSENRARASDFQYIPHAEFASNFHHRLSTVMTSKSPRVALVSMSCQNGTSTVRQQVRPLATTRMSTSAPLPSTTTPSAASPTSSSCARPGCPMASPTPSTSVTTPLS